jgi:AcrR family transcriptional regulator
MTQPSQTARTRPQYDARRQERAHRILDAAGALILRWGYNKTTIDDIARQAGVAKGTIYLHWKTREDLFGALMKRERVALAEDFKQRIAGDPVGATLHGMLKHSALALMQRPLLKAALLRDMEIVGKLVHSEQSTAALVERMAGFKTYLEFLREHDLVRTDLSLRAQVYMVGAIFLGFFLLAPLMPEDWTVSDAELADLMAETVHRALEPNRTLSPDELQAAALPFMQYIDRDTALANDLLREEIE